MWLDVDVALAEVPINCVSLIDDTDFKTREESVVYNQAGLDLVWNFVTSTGAYTQTAVTPTDTGGDYDWVNQGNGMYSIEIPASGGASINNDTEGYGWFTGYATGILPWAGPIIGFRAAGLNDKLTDSAYSATRGLAGTALPDAVADAAGGVPISDAGGLDIDAKLANTNEVTTARMGALTDWINGGRLDNLLDAIPAVGAIADAVFDEAKAGHTGVGSFGEEIQSHATPAEVDTECDEALTNYDAPTKAEMDTAHALLATPAQVNTQCDAALSDYGANTTIPDVAGTAAGLHTTTNGKIDTAQADLDTITGTGGVLIGTDAMDRSGTLDVNAKKIGGNVDTGATQIARTGADSDTLETLSDQIDGLGSSTDVTSIKGTDLTETNAGDLANNISQFFDVNPTTTKDVNDVGGGAATVPPVLED